MERSLAAWKEGHAEEAYQLAVTAYLEGFELAEGSIDDVDRDLRTRTEQAMMAYEAMVRRESSTAKRRLIRILRLCTPP